MNVTRELLFWLIPLIMYLGICHLVASYVGAKKKIGFGKTLLISILFGPLIGLIVAAISQRHED